MVFNVFFEIVLIVVSKKKEKRKAALNFKTAATVGLAAIRIQEDAAAAKLQARQRGRQGRALS